MNFPLKDTIYPFSQGSPVYIINDLHPKNWAIHNVNFWDGKITVKGADICEEEKVRDGVFLPGPTMLYRYKYSTVSAALRLTRVDYHA